MEEARIAAQSTAVRDAPGGRVGEAVRDMAAFGEGFGQF